MAVLFIAGFEEDDWSRVFSSYSIWASTTTKPRTGARGLEGATFGWPGWDTGLLSGSSSSVTCGMAVWIPPSNSGVLGSAKIFQYINAAGVNLANCILIANDGSFHIYGDANTEVASSGVGTKIAYGAWNYIEFAAYCPSYPTASHCSLWLNGEIIIDTDYPTMNSDPSYNGPIVRVVSGGYGNWHLGNTGSATVDHRPYIDDLYIRTGMTPYGDCGVYRMHITGTGTSTAWAPVGDTPNWKCVDDVDPDDNTTYVESNTLNQKDYYALENVTVSGTIHAVAATIRGTKTANGTRAVRLFIKSGSETNGRTLYLPLDGYKTDFHSVFETKPAGGAWDQSALDALEVGIELTV